MRLRELADLIEALQRPVSVEELRVFGKAHEATCDRPERLLAAWVEAQRKREPLRYGEAWGRMMSGFAAMLYALSFGVGLIAVLGVLHYNGTAPVNAVYLFAVAVFLPGLSLLLSLAALAAARRAHNPLLHAAVSYLTERIWFRRKGEVVTELVKHEPRILAWAALKRMHGAALAYSAGVLVGLLGSVVMQDIAFVWSTTLDVSSQEVAAWLRRLSAPWQGVWPEAVPDATLVEQSRYFRLGGRIDSEMVARAEVLGRWWKFLFAATLTYALLPRLIVAFVARAVIGTLASRSALRLAREHLEAMCTPLATAVAEGSEAVRLPETSDGVCRASLRNRYDTLVLFGLDEEVAAVCGDLYGIDATRTLRMGGGYTATHDRSEAARAQGDTIVLVKAWEPPTFEVLESIAYIAEHAETTAVLPVGLPEEEYRASQADISVWRMMMQRLESEKICLIETT